MRGRMCNPGLSLSIAGTEVEKGEGGGSKWISGVFIMEPPVIKVTLHHKDFSFSLFSHPPSFSLLKMMTIIDLLREAERSPLPFRGQGRGQKLPTPLAGTENKYRGLPLVAFPQPAKPYHLHYSAAVRASHTKSL